jgi:hypothetical protein
MRETRLRLFVVALILTAIVAIVAIVGVAQAAQPSTYSATLPPNSVGAGTTNSHTFTITKVAGGRNIGSVNIAVPTDFTVNLPFGAVTSSPAGKTWTAALVGNVVELRAGSGAYPPLKNGESLSVGISLTAPCTAGSYTFDVTAKESRSFSGSAVLDGNDPSITVTGTCGGGFVTCEAGESCSDPAQTTTISSTIPLLVRFESPQDTCGGTAFVSQQTIEPLADSDYVVTFTYDNSIAPDEGARSLGLTRFCVSKDDGATWTRLLGCDGAHPAPCVLDREKNEAGDITYVVKFPAGDPGSGFG